MAPTCTLVPASRSAAIAASVDSRQSSVDGSSLFAGFQRGFIIGESAGRWQARGVPVPAAGGGGRGALLTPLPPFPCWKGVFSCAAVVSLSPFPVRAFRGRFFVRGPAAVPDGADPQDQLDA